MSSITILKTQLPAKSVIYQYSSTIHYHDAFECTFTSANKINHESCVYAFFDTAPSWLNKLMALRDRIVKLFGLKTSTTKSREDMRKAFTAALGNSLGLFKVLDKTENEIIMGEDDKHLNFRVSLLLHKLEALNTYTLTLSTTVHINNLMGKLYFLPVQPLHKLIVPVMLKGIIRHLQKPVPDN